MRHDERKLKWVIRNRIRPDRARSVGTLVGGLVSEFTSQTPDRAKAAQAIAAIADEEFRRHCSLVKLSGKSALIQVDEPGLVGVMRLAWSGPIQQALAQACRSKGSKDAGLKRGWRVRFEYRNDVHFRAE
jgi:hypothetical protein